MHFTSHKLVDTTERTHFNGRGWGLFCLSYGEEASHKEDFEAPDEEVQWCCYQSESRPRVGPGRAENSLASLRHTDTAESSVTSGSVGRVSHEPCTSAASSGPLYGGPNHQRPHDFVAFHCDRHLRDQTDDDVGSGRMVQSHCGVCGAGRRRPDRFDQCHPLLFSGITTGAGGVRQHGHLCPVCHQRPGNVPDRNQRGGGPRICSSGSHAF